MYEMWLAVNKVIATISMLTFWPTLQRCKRFEIEAEI